MGGRKRKKSARRGYVSLVLVETRLRRASFILCWRGNPGKIDGETRGRTALFGGKKRVSFFFVFQEESASLADIYIYIYTRIRGSFSRSETSSEFGFPGGVARRFGALRRAYDAYFESLVSGTAVKAAPACSAGLPPLRTVTLCHSCHIQRPLRSKHCRVSRKCVMAFDHYCPYVGNTVGMYNYRWFCLYCLSFTLSAIQWQAVALCYQRRRGQGWALTAAQIWFVPFIFFGLAMVAYHAQLTFQNLTTNEHMNFARYDCFKDEESGALRNPFDKGLCNNLADKFFPPKIDQHPLLLQIARQHAPNNNQTQHAHSKKQAE